MIVIYTDKFGNTQIANTAVEMPEVISLATLNKEVASIPFPNYGPDGLISEQTTIGGDALLGYNKLSESEEAYGHDFPVVSSTQNSALSDAHVQIAWRNVKSGVITKRWPMKWGVYAAANMITGMMAQLSSGTPSFSFSYDDPD